MHGILMFDKITFKQGFILTLTTRKVLLLPMHIAKQHRNKLKQSESLNGENNYHKIIITEYVHSCLQLVSRILHSS